MNKVHQDHDSIAQESLKFHPYKNINLVPTFQDPVSVFKPKDQNSLESNLSKSEALQQEIWVLFTY